MCSLGSAVNNNNKIWERHLHRWSLQSRGQTDNKQKKLNVHRYLGFTGGSVVKNSPASAGDTGDASLIPGSGRCSGGRNGNPAQYSCLGNSMAREAWQAAVRGVTKSWIPLNGRTHKHTDNYLSLH